MKGVVLGVCPDATLVDIAHDIPAARRDGRRPGARRLLPYFPPARSSWSWSIPASGSPRRGLAVETADYRFVAPDNGVLSGACRDAAEESGRAHRAANTRGRPSAGPSKAATASRRPRRGWPRASALASLGGPLARLPAARAAGSGRHRRSSVGCRAYRRSLRQRDHQHRPPYVRARGGGPPSASWPGHTRSARWFRLTPKQRQVSRAPCSAAPITSRWRSPGAARPSVSGWPPAPRCASSASPDARSAKSASINGFGRHGRSGNQTCRIR